MNNCGDQCPSILSKKHRKLRNMYFLQLCWFWATMLIIKILTQSFFLIPHLGFVNSGLLSRAFAWQWKKWKHWSTFMVAEPIEKVQYKLSAMIIEYFIKFDFQTIEIISIFSENWYCKNSQKFTYHKYCQIKIINNINFFLIIIYILI